MLNLIAPWNSTGYGGVGKNLLLSIHEKLGESLFYENIGGFDGIKPPFFSSLKQVDRNSEFPAFCCWHDFSLNRLLEQKGPKALYTFFEVDPLPPERALSLNQLDLIFQPSRWGKEVLERSGVTIPIEVLRPGVDRTIFNEDVLPAVIEGVSAETFVVFVAGKWEVRKGYDILLKVLHRAFRPDDDFLLVVNATNPVHIAGKFDGTAISKEWEFFYKNSILGRAEKIHIIENRLDTQEELATLMSRADIGVFLSRAEGANLEAMEMLSMGKNIILSNCTAHTEFGIESGALLVNYDSKELALERPFFMGDSHWSEPTENNKNEAALILRNLYEQWSKNGGLPINRAGIQVFKDLSWANAAKQIVNWTFL